jgi:DNA topoisomerase I
VLWIEPCRGCDDLTAPPQGSRAGAAGAALNIETPTAIASTIPKSLSGSPSLRSRRRGGKCGSAWGVRRVQAIADEDVLQTVSALKRRRRGGQLLAYRDGRQWVEIHAEDVNAYIKQAGGGEFTAKDFRTWNATVLAAVALAGHEGKASSPTARRRVISAAVRTVAAYIGNTPAVCRASYIDPRVIDSYPITIAPALERLPRGPDLANPRTRTRIEAAVLELLGR